jgi:transposase
MANLFWLSDVQWKAIQPHLPTNQPGARRVDDRRVISGIFHVLKSGCRWIDCPAEYGPHTTIYNRFNRWSRRRFGIGIFEAISKEEAITRTTSIDSSYVKAQRSAFGGEGGKKNRRSASRVVARRARSMRSPTSSAGLSR